MKSTISSAREAAFLILLKADEGLAENALSQYSLSLSELDRRLAKEMVLGTIKRKRTLEAILGKIHEKKRSIKKELKILLWLACYQYLFMNRIPEYALVNEIVKVAKKRLGGFDARFINALLRKLTASPPNFWLESVKDNWGDAYSYPDFFISSLRNEYGVEKTKEILEVENRFFPPQVRKRNPLLIEIEEGLKKVYEGKFFSVYEMEKEASLVNIAQNKEYYIQNVTPVYLAEKLYEESFKNPQNILDLCSSPGGKLILAHDLFFKARLMANDLSEDKISKVKENLAKYEIDARWNISRGEDFRSDEKFDLVIADVPCSNSGVLHKRAEARWRLEKENLLELVKLQKALLSKAADLVTSHGQIWYMTCSILQEENEEVVNNIAEAKNLKILKMSKILPSREGWDGGFGALLSHL